MITIQDESAQQLKSPLSLTRKGDKFKTKDGMIIPSPTLNTIEKNIFYLLKNSVEKEFKQKYKMRPSYLSYDEYGNQFLGEMLMIVNNVYCLEDFDMDKVLIPSIESLIKINTDNFVMFSDYKNVLEINWSGLSPN